LRTDTKRNFHLGVNYLLTPAVAVSTVQQLKFQQLLADPVKGIVFDTTQKLGDAVGFLRQAPHLEVKVGPVGPQVSQLLITAPDPKRLIEDFEDECDFVVEAYNEVWGAPTQILRRDCTIRHLYAVQEEHAFQFLWEKRLHQASDALGVFGRPIIGGGIRLVLPPETPDQPLFEVKIESLLADASQLFVETSAVWNQPVSGEQLDPRALLEPAEQFMNNEVRSFIQADQ
jgi:hypothetical protein